MVLVRDRMVVVGQRALIAKVSWRLDLDLEKLESQGKSMCFP